MKLQTFFDIFFFREIYTVMSSKVPKNVALDLKHISVQNLPILLSKCHLKEVISFFVNP